MLDPDFDLDDQPRLTRRCRSVSTCIPIPSRAHSICDAFRDHDQTGDLDQASLRTFLLGLGRKEQEIDRLLDTAAAAGLFSGINQTCVFSKFIEWLYAPSGFDWRGFLAGCRSCVIFCHGGCPDGIGAARLVQGAFQTLGMSQFEIIELEHPDRAVKGASFIREDSAVLYVDISPYEEDLPLLRRARKALVIDHHESVLGRMEAVKMAMPSLLDLSCVKGNHSAASLVAYQMESLLKEPISQLDRKVAILRKKDVWEYKIDEQWIADAMAFGAFIQSQPSCTLPMIDEFLEDIETCLSKGRIAAEEQKRASDQLYSQLQRRAEASQPWRMCVYVVELEENILHDSKAFVKSCEKLDPPGIVLRAFKFKRDMDFIDVRVCRSNPKVGHLGEICKQVWAANPHKFKGGGGHPFAAGVQVVRDLWDPTDVAKLMLRAAGCVPEKKREPEGDESMSTMPTEKSFWSVQATSTTSEYTYLKDEVLEHLRAVKSDDIRGCAGNVAMALKQAPSLTLTGEELGQDCGLALAEVIKTNNTLHTLYLKSNDFSGEAGKALGNALAENSCLARLHIGKCGLGPEAGHAFGYALETNSSLRMLGIASNNIGPEAGLEIAAALEKNTVLRELRIRKNGLGPDVAKAFAQALRINTSLNSLNLEENGLDPDSGRVLLEAVENNDKLLDLRIGRNNLGPQNAALIARVIRKNHTMQVFGLQSSGLGAEAGPGIVAAMELNNHLLQLYLDGNGISNEDIEAVNQQLDEHAGVAHDEGNLKRARISQI